MKKQIILTTTSDEFIPDNIDERLATEICDYIEDKIIERFSRAGRMIDVDFDDFNWGGNRMTADVIVYINGEPRRQGTFDFTAYDSYWDESDYDEHIHRAAINFVDSL